MNAAELRDFGIDPVIVANVGLSIPNAFKIQAQTDVHLVKVAKHDPKIRSEVDISAILGMSSPALMGSLGIFFPEKTFLNIVSKMLGETFPELTQEISDAAGEMLNIIYGSARTKINESGHNFSPAIPNVIRGKELQVAHSEGMNVVVIFCNSELGPFHVEIGLKKVG